MKRPILACLDLEGVLVPEVWMELAKKTKIDELLATTREIPDYDVLMRRRLEILKRHALTLHDIQQVAATIDPLEGAVEYLAWLRERYQAVILSDTFYEFIMPLMRKLSYPTLFSHTLEVGSSGEILNYHLRQPDQKRHCVNAFKGLQFTVVAIGDSYNDTAMLQAAHAGIFFRPPDAIRNEFPQFPVARTYAELRQHVERAVQSFE